MTAHAFLIDDNKDYASLLQKELLETKLIGLVTFFESGEKAVSELDALIERKAPKNEFPNLIILDIIFPSDTSGIEILERLKKAESTRDIPVVLHSASEEKSHLVDSYKKGGAVFIKKQKDSQALREALMQLRLSGRF